ncbi:hypothetical protein B0H11DRAFT_447381 [Mycena galericulata]|nr:hypothetical protein B0H11DRAFT_447381 [Mycena galericulata]
MPIFAKTYSPTLNRPFSYAFSERMDCPKGYSGMDTPFAEYMAGIHWDLRKGTKRIDEKGRRRQLQSHGRDIPSEPPSTELYDYEMQHLSHNAPDAILAATCWTTSVTESGSSAYSQLVDASCYNRATANFQPLDAQAIFIGYNADGSSSAPTPWASTTVHIRPSTTYRTGMSTRRATDTSICPSARTRRAGRSRILGADCMASG